jgi:hypothetical protein
MAKIKKAIALVLAGSAVSMIFTACAQLDVVGQQSITSFKAVLDASGDNVKADELNVGWSLTAPDDSARFIWSEDYSKAPLHDVMIELDAQPFLDAGLDTSKLPDNYVFYEGETMGGMGSKMLMVGTKLGTDKLKYNGEPTPLAAYEQIVGKYRESINYHTALDHYGVMLGDGNMFEWAKDLKTNSSDNSVQDKDIVFVLNPEPLTAAGVDPEKVEGWVYAQVPVEEGGKMTQVWKLLKPFDLQ